MSIMRNKYRAPTSGQVKQRPKSPANNPRAGDREYRNIQMLYHHFLSDLMAGRLVLFKKECPIHRRIFRQYNSQGILKVELDNKPATKLKGTLYCRYNGKRFDMRGHKDYKSKSNVRSPYRANID